MKRTLLLTALSAALLFSNSTEAQIPGVSKVTKALPKVDLGLKVGANFQQLTGTSWKQAYKPGIVFGAFLGVYKNKMGVQAEGLIRSVRFDYNAPTSPYVKTLSLDIPVMFEYKLIPRIWVQVGPQFSQILSAKDNTGKDVKTSFNASEFSGLLGLQVKLPAHIVAGARYVLGFTDIRNSSVTTTSDSWKNRSIQAYVGFRFL